MFAAVLPARGRRALEHLAGADLLSAFYMAGGTALALHLGHRLSEDLDFFSGVPFDPFDLRQRLEQLGPFEVLDQRRGTLHGLFQGVRLSFLFYRYPLLFQPASFLRCRVAVPRDIAPMKMDAIASRGSRKDFFDLYFIAREVAGLEECLELYRRKYAGTGFNLYHVLKSLTYFADAEREKDPVLLRPVTWAQVKDYFEREAPRLLVTALGLGD